MPAPSGYSAVNIKLNLGFDAYDRLMFSGGRIYMVFWWNNIPLGDLYYCGGRNENEIQSKKMLRHAIANSVAFYVQEYKFLFDESTIAGKEQGAGLLNLLDSLFSRREMITYLNKLDVSVVICTRNRSAELKQCLKSLIDQDYQPTEIIVVDNAPNDNSTEITCAEFPGVKYILEKAVGLDIARNTGARHAMSSIVAYTDDDVLLTQNWCYEVWSTFQQKDVDAMTGLIIASSLETESQIIFEKHWGFNKGYVDKLFDPSFLMSAAPRVWDIGAGANMAFRRTALEKANYFDKRLDAGKAGCSGDSEIWFRLLYMGSKIYYNPRAVVYHKHRREISSLKNQIYFYMRGHAAATMIQHELSNQSGYLKYLRMGLPRYYLTQLRKGFPFYRGRYMTLGNEIKGLISGVKYFYRNRARDY